jgi:hypothetical protein
MVPARANGPGQNMIEPIAPLAITGFLWYQGEANSERAFQYRTLLPAMIGDWRRLFAQGDLPFYIVSLPAFMHHQDQPTEAAWRSCAKHKPSLRTLFLIPVWQLPSIPASLTISSPGQEDCWRTTGALRTGPTLRQKNSLPGTNLQIS